MSIQAPESLVSVGHQVIRRLMEFGNFDEFRDHREESGLNEEAASIIEDEFERFSEAERARLTALTEHLADEAGAWLLEHFDDGESTFVLAKAITLHLKAMLP